MTSLVDGDYLYTITIVMAVCAFIKFHLVIFSFLFKNEKRNLHQKQKRFAENVRMHWIVFLIYVFNCDWQFVLLLVRFICIFRSISVISIWWCKICTGLGRAVIAHTSISIQLSRLWNNISIWTWCGRECWSVKREWAKKQPWPNLIFILINSKIL